MIAQKTPSYAERLPEFKKVKLRICNIILEARNRGEEPLTRSEIQREYFERYRHFALLGNRLRELRKDLEVENGSLKGKLKTWRLTDKWK